MKCLKLVLLLCFCVQHIAFAQTFAFKAKLIHNKKGLMKNTTILVNSNPATTNDAGILVIGLPQNTTHVKVALQQTDYTVLYPTAGYVAIPRDLNDMPEIIIGNPNDNTYLNQYLSLVKEIKNSSNAGLSEVIALSKKLDSLQSALLQMNYTESDLRSAREMQEGRDRYYKEISENLNDYVNRSIDLTSAFEYVSSFAFDNPVALQQLNKAVTEYTDVCKTLNRQRDNYKKYISDYWQNDSLTNSYEDLIEYALDTFYTKKLTPLNEDIVLINKNFSGTKTKELKDIIQQHIKEQSPVLHQALDALKQKNIMFQKEIFN